MLNYDEFMYTAQASPTVKTPKSGESFGDMSRAFDNLATRLRGGTDRMQGDLWDQPRGSSRDRSRGTQGSEPKVFTPLGPGFMPSTPKRSAKSPGRRNLTLDDSLSMTLLHEPPPQEPASAAMVANAAAIAAAEAEEAAAEAEAMNPKSPRTPEMAHTDFTYRTPQSVPSASKPPALTPDSFFAGANSALTVDVYAASAASPLSKPPKPPASAPSPSPAPRRSQRSPGHLIMPLLRKDRRKASNSTPIIGAPTIGTPIGTPTVSMPKSSSSYASSGSSSSGTPGNSSAGSFSGLGGFRGFSGSAGSSFDTGASSVGFSKGTSYSSISALDGTPTCTDCMTDLTIPGKEQRIINVPCAHKIHEGCFVRRVTSPNFDGHLRCPLCSREPDHDHLVKLLMATGLTEAGVPLPPQSNKGQRRPVVRLYPDQYNSMEMLAKEKAANAEQPKFKRRENEVSSDSNSEQGASSSNDATQKHDHITGIENTTTEEGKMRSRQMVLKERTARMRAEADSPDILADDDDAITPSVNTPGFGLPHFAPQINALSLLPSALPTSPTSLNSPRSPTSSVMSTTSVVSDPASMVSTPSASSTASVLSEAETAKSADAELAGAMFSPSPRRAKAGRVRRPLNRAAISEFEAVNDLKELRSLTTMFGRADAEPGLFYDAVRAFSHPALVRPAGSGTLRLVHGVDQQGDEADVVVLVQAAHEQDNTSEDDLIPIMVPLESRREIPRRDPRRAFSAPSHRPTPSRSSSFGSFSTGSRPAPTPPSTRLVLIIPEQESLSSADTIAEAVLRACTHLSEGDLVGLIVYRADGSQKLRTPLRSPQWEGWRAVLQALQTTPVPGAPRPTTGELIIDTLLEPAIGENGLRETYLDDLDDKSAAAATSVLLVTQNHVALRGTDSTEPISTSPVSAIGIGSRHGEIALAHTAAATGGVYTFAPSCREAGKAIEQFVAQERSVAAVELRLVPAPNATITHITKGKLGTPVGPPDHRGGVNVPLGRVRLGETKVVYFKIRGRVRPEHALCSVSMHTDGPPPPISTPSPPPTVTSAPAAPPSSRPYGGVAPLNIRKQVPRKPVSGSTLEIFVPAPDTRWQYEAAGIVWFTFALQSAGDSLMDCLRTLCSDSGPLVGANARAQAAAMLTPAITELLQAAQAALEIWGPKSPAAYVLNAARKVMVEHEEWLLDLGTQLRDLVLLTVQRLLDVAARRSLLVRDNFEAIFAHPVA